MLKPSAWVIAGAVLATAGLAHAQETPSRVADVSAARAAAPWHERFTTSHGLTESITGTAENDRLVPLAWAMNQRWGVIVDVREAIRIDRDPEGGRGDQTAVGAYYSFTPRVRVGGRLSLETARRPGAASVAREEEEGPAAGVRIESAFRF